MHGAVEGPIIHLPDLKTKRMEIIERAIDFWFQMFTIWKATSLAIQFGSDCRDKTVYTHHPNSIPIDF